VEKGKVGKQPAEDIPGQKQGGPDDEKGKKSSPQTAKKRGKVKGGRAGKKGSTSNRFLNRERRGNVRTPRPVIRSKTVGQGSGKGRIQEWVFDRPAMGSGEVRACAPKITPEGGGLIVDSNGGQGAWGNGCSRRSRTKPTTT